MDESVMELQEDLRKRLDRLYLMHNEPALYVADHFADLRAQVDYDAERLLSKMQPIEFNSLEAQNDSDVHETRLDYIRILEELEKRTHLRPKPENDPNKVYFSLEQRVDAFKDSSNLLDDLEDSYVQLARDICDETDRLKKYILGEQTILYWPSEDKVRFGSLVYLGDVFLNQRENDLLIDPLLVQAREPHEFSKSQQVVRNLFYEGFRLFASKSKFFYVGKSKEEYSGYSAEGSDVEKQFASYQSQELITFSKFEGRLYFDISVNLFEVKSSTGCTLYMNNFRLGGLHYLLPSPATRLTELILNGVHFESFDIDMLAKCTSLSDLRLNVTFSKNVKFDLAFLRAFKMLDILELTLPDTPSDFSMFQHLSELKSLRLQGTSFFYAEKMPKLSKVALEQILSTPLLQMLTLTCLEIETIDREILNRCKQLWHLNISRCRISGDICIRPGFPLCFKEPEEKAEHLANKPPTICIELIHTDIRALSATSFTGMSNLKHLFLIGNSIVDLPCGVFQDLPSLERLELNKNQIRRINSGVFGRLNSLRKLTLDGNPIESIEANAFVQLHKLYTLSLVGCRLKSIDNEMFTGLNGLVELKLDNNLIERIEVIAEDGRRINVAKADLNIEERELAKMHHFKEVSSLYLSGNKLEKLDLNCFSNLKCLRELDVSSNKINELSGEIGPELFPKFEKLVLNDNQLITIDRRALPKTLTDLYLSKNRLKRLDEDFFAEFEHLVCLSLDQNELTMDITKAAFASFRHSLGKIYLSQNESIRVTQGAFAQMPRLFRIDFDFSEHCAILPRCRTLRIRRLTPAALQALQKLKSDKHVSFRDRLEVYCLSNCSIKALQRNSDLLSVKETAENNCTFNLSALSCNTKLRELDLSLNLIETLDDPDLFADFKSISKINLSGNRLKSIHRGIFNSLHRLDTIDLSGNKLSSIDTGLFRNQECLRHLNLSSNGISFLNLARLFRICQYLESLNIAENQLDEQSTAEPIDARTCCYLVSLKSANNRLETMNFVRDMIKLRHLDLRGNRIDSIMSNEENMLGRLHELLHLDLSENPIADSEMFNHLKGRFEYMNLSTNPHDFSAYKVLREHSRSVKHLLFNLKC